MELLAYCSLTLNHWFFRCYIICIFFHSNEIFFNSHIIALYVQKCLERVFSECGPILKVYLHKAPNAGAPVEEETKYFKKIQPAKVGV